MYFSMPEEVANGMDGALRGSDEAVSVVAMGAGAGW